MESAEQRREQEQYAEQDRVWTAPKLISIGAVTLVIAISIIVTAAAQTGCSLVWVP